MKKNILGSLSTLFLALALGGMLLEWDLRRGMDDSDLGQAAGPFVVEKQSGAAVPTIEDDTAVVFQQIYLKSQDTVSGALPERQTLTGKTLEDIYRFYPQERGYEVAYADNELTIRQRIDDFSPVQKQKYRLKMYQDFVAVYQGPDAASDILKRVTSIRGDWLPVDIQEKIRNGAYEFESIHQLNDILMNFDEWAE